MAQRPQSPAVLPGTLVRHAAHGAPIPYINVQKR